MQRAECRMFLFKSVVPLAPDKMSYQQQIYKKKNTHTFALNTTQYQAHTLVPVQFSLKE